MYLGETAEIKRRKENEKDLHNTNSNNVNANLVLYGKSGVLLAEMEKN